MRTQYPFTKAHQNVFDRDYVCTGVVLVVPLKDGSTGFGLLLRKLSRQQAAAACHGISEKCHKHTGDSQL